MRNPAMSSKFYEMPVNEMAAEYTIFWSLLGSFVMK
jgi:hypothetical protein